MDHKKNNVPKATSRRVNDAPGHEAFPLGQTFALRQMNNTAASELQVKLGGGVEADRAAVKILAALEQQGEVADVAGFRRGVLLIRADASTKTMSAATDWSATAKNAAVSDLRQRALEYEATLAAPGVSSATAGNAVPSGELPVTKIADHVRYEGTSRLLDLTGKDLRGVAELGAQLQQVRRAYPGIKVDFSGANLSGMQLQNADLTQIVFDGADLSQAKLGGADLHASRFVKANLSGANLNGARADSNFDGADLSGAWLNDTNLKGAGLHGADLRRANLTEAQMLKADLRGADLRDAVLENTNLNGASLPGAQLDRTVLRGASLLRADLQGVSARNASFVGANLNQTDFRAADLSGSDLSRTKLIGAQLGGANLTNVSVGRAVVSGIDLTGARQDGVDWAQIVPLPAPEPGPRTLLDIRHTLRRVDRPIPPRPVAGQPVTQIAAFVEVQEGRKVLNLVGKDLRNAPDLVSQVRELRRDFPGVRLDLRRATLGDMQLPGIDLTGAILDGADFSRANLSGADLNAVRALKTNFRAAVMVSVAANGNFDSSNFSGAVLDRANLTNAGLHATNMNRASLIEARLGKADMRDANLTGANLRSAAMNDSRLNGAALIGADFESASLYKADLTGVRARTSIFMRANLTQAKLGGADFSSAKLGRANLTNAATVGADFRNAQLEGADLTGVDFSKAMR